MASVTKRLLLVHIIKYQHSKTSSVDISIARPLVLLTTINLTCSRATSNRYNLKRVGVKSVGLRIMEYDKCSVIVAKKSFQEIQLV